MQFFLALAMERFAGFFRGKRVANQFREDEDSALAGDGKAICDCRWPAPCSGRSEEQAMGSVAIASDFDSTLYFRDREPCMRDEDISAIRQFREEGGIFGVCTGRPYYGVLEAAAEVISFDFHICTSGARIIGRQGESIADRRLSRSLVQELWELGRNLPFMVVQANDRLYSPRPVSKNFQVQVQSLDEIPGEAFYGVSFYADTPEAAADLAAYASRRWGGSISAYHNSICMDAVAGGVSKGGALMQVKSLLNVSAIAAIGDSYNDISMLEAADISFTFPDSPAEVQAAADHIVTSVADAVALLGKHGV